MNDSVQIKENGDMSFNYDRTTDKKEKSISTSTTISNFDDEINNSFHTNNKLIHSSSPIMISNIRFKDKTHAFNPRNLIKEEDEEYDDITNAGLDEFNSSIGLKPIKKSTFNFYSHQELAERVSLSSNGSLQESNLNAYKANKLLIDENEHLANYAKNLDCSNLDNDVFLDDSHNKTRDSTSSAILVNRKRQSIGSESSQSQSSDDRNTSISSTEELINNIQQFNIENDHSLNQTQNEADLEKGLICYYNDYINPIFKNRKDLSLSETKSFEEFKEALIKSTKQLDQSQISFYKENLNKTRSLLFFMEGVETAPSTPITKSTSGNLSSSKSSITENDLNNSNESLSIKGLESSLLSLYKKLKSYNNTNPIISNEIFISILTFAAEWPKLPEIVKSKMQNFIQLMEVEAYNDAKNIQETLFFDFEDHVSNFICGISKLLTELSKRSMKNW